MEDLKQVVYDVVLNVVLENQVKLCPDEPGIVYLEADHKLVDQLGLTSLDLARIVAILEIKLEVDPFARLVPITSVRTVGDLHEAYAKCFEPTVGAFRAPLATVPAPETENTPNERRNERGQRRKLRSQVRRSLS